MLFRSEGTEIYLEGGRVKEVKSCGMAPGTDIIVENIFFNTPARMKFLKSTETEAAHAGDLMLRLAISRPDVGFTYLCDGREQFRTAPGTLLQRLQSLLPKGTALFPIQGEAGTVTARGFIAPPDSAKSSYSSMFTFINGRFVRDKVVQHAIMQAWRPVLEKGRYPVMALFIELPPSEVDVNVHPTKHEVRFRHQKQVHDTIHGVLSQTLSHSPWLTRTSGAEEPASVPDGAVKPLETLPAEHSAAIRQAADRFISSSQPGLFRRPVASVGETPSPYSADEPETDATGGYFSSLSVIGQFRGAYILCEGDDGLVIIDQHAAFERVRFEQLKKTHSGGRVASQRLLSPEMIELSFSEADTVRSNLAGLASLGFELDEFGGRTFRLNSVPAMAASENYTRLLLDIIQEFSATGTSESLDLIIENILSTIACHSVTRGTRMLEQRQIRQLLSDMDRTDFSAHCPHGRPVSHSIPLKELEKLFRRT
mgnify:CR=1 FL=1